MTFEVRDGEVHATRLLGLVNYPSVRFQLTAMCDAKQETTVIDFTEDKAVTCPKCIELCGVR